ncbi:MAG: helix-turn-helix domain-containing protein [Candidatus Glassbacteria bacterium]
MDHDVSTLDYLKIMEARRLIVQTDLSIESIAKKLGFSTMEEFERKFRRLERKRPRTVRNDNNNSKRLHEPEAPDG